MNRMVGLLSIASLFSVGCCCQPPQAQFRPDRFEVNGNNLAIRGWMVDSRLCVEARLKPHDGTSLHDMTLVNAEGGRLPPYTWTDKTPQTDEGYVGHELRVGLMPFRWPGSRYDYYNQYYSSTPPREIDACWQPVIDQDTTEGTMVVTLLYLSREQIEVTTIPLSMELAPPTKKGLQHVIFHVKEPPETRTIPVLNQSVPQ